MLFFYSIVIFFYGLFIRIASLFSDKAKLWIFGRKNWKNNLQKNTPPGGFDLWMHCSSLGEFEQGRPVLEAYRKSHSSAKILLSFFSPSGYEIRKNYEVVDYICYLPLDTKSNAKKWLSIAAPKQTIIVKYDFWFHFLLAIKNSPTKAILISALFNKNHFFDSWIGKYFKYTLSAFQAIFFQKEPAFPIEKSILIEIVGDTRVDRVLKIQEENSSNKALAHWVAENKVMIWGSVWDHDLFILKSALIGPLKDWKHIIAPHEPNIKNINGIEENCPLNFQLFSEPINSKTQVIIVDSIGQLSSLYKYGSASYIGGGFGNGIHNTLEPMAASCPVIIGPKYFKFPEAIEGIKNNIVFSINNVQEFKNICKIFVQPNALLQAQNECQKFIKSKAGATSKILQYLEEIG